jgi:hypothetical protein
VTVDLRTRIPTSVLGEDGADALVVMGTPGADRILLTPGVTSVGAVLVTHAAESVTVEGLAGDDSFDLQGFYEGVSVTLDGGDGNDTFAPFDASSARSLDDWRGTATFVGGAGVDSLLLDDRANISGYGFEVDGSSVRRTLTAPIGYSGLERLTIQAGPGNNPFAVTPSAQTAIEVRGGDPAAGAAEWDSLVLTPRGATAGIFTPGSEAGSGTYTFSNRQPVTFTGVERASADLTPPAVLAAAFVPGGGGKAVVRVTFGEDVGASLAAGDLALTNVATGDMRSATGVTFDPGSGVATFTVPDLADGNWRATLAAAGVEDAAGNPLAADFSTDFFVLAGDANRDRVVNFADLLVLAKNYNKAGATWAEGDFTGDGVVNFADLLVLAKAYNTAVAAPAPLLSGEPAVAPVSATASVLGEEGKTAPVFSTTRVAKPAAAVAPAKPVVVKAKAAGRAKGR